MGGRPSLESTDDALSKVWTVAIKATRSRYHAPLEFVGTDCAFYDYLHLCCGPLASLIPRTPIKSQSTMHSLRGEGVHVEQSFRYWRLVIVGDSNTM